jgi:hypothetical protein
MVMLELVRLIHNEKITLKVVMLGTDIQVLCYGGNKPHIGAVSLAVPYESKNMTGASVSTLTVLSHREDLVSRQLAESFCKQLKASVAVSCGIHYEQITKELILEIQNVVTDMSQELIAEMQNQTLFAVDDSTE